MAAANKLVLLGPDEMAEADRIAASGVTEQPHRRCAFTKVRTSASLAARYLVADGCSLDDLITASYGTRRVCRLIRHVTLRADGVISRQGLECAPHMAIVCVRGVAHVAGDCVGFGRCVMERGTLYLAPSTRSVVVCGNPSCELLLFFVDHITPITQPVLPDEVLLTRDLSLVTYNPDRAVVFKAEYDAEAQTARLFIKGYMLRVEGLTLETREGVGDDCDCCFQDASVLSLDRQKLLGAARTVPTTTPGVLSLRVRERGWADVYVEAKGHCEPAMLRMALASLRLVFGMLRSVVGRCENSLFYYGIIPVADDCDHPGVEMMDID
ncbi:hypothetical protein SB87_gp120 [Parapoxvirus red deer/HL953]|uniref:Protein OPG181 n=1 Tax=Parapoxvirus red deer/HL953 TaxID=1579460 RepID=A0A0A7MAC7_9POXV|nr:hypothetical protein SB87_gp120 [Parapoxvirus red deer/HL953]AIZ77373.1 hypothetical protein [Parapoxvirus red deer/HL953]